MSFLHGLNYIHRTVLIFLSFFLISFMLATGKTPAVVSHITIQKLGFLCVVLQLCEFYRQRFYLDRWNEWGFHWRVAFLHYAKWPWFLLAFLDVLFRKQKPYVLTLKTKLGSREHPLLLSNLIVIILLLGSWFIGQMLNRDTNPIVYGCAAILLITSVALMWTEFWRFPAPYDKEIMSIALLKEHERRVDGAPESFLRDKPVPRENVVQRSVGRDAIFLSHSTMTSPNGEGGGAVDPEIRQVSIRNQESEED